MDEKNKTIKEKTIRYSCILLEYLASTKMNDNSSTLDLNNLWVEYKNPDGRVSSLFCFIVYF